MTSQTQPFQLENCAAWHDAQAIKHPERRAHHEALSEDLMWRAYRLRRALAEISRAA